MLVWSFVPDSLDVNAWDACSRWFVPEGPLDGFTALPIQVYDWSTRPRAEFHRLAAAGILVLLAVLLPMNGVAVMIRAWHQRRRV